MSGFLFALLYVASLFVTPALIFSVVTVRLTGDGIETVWLGITTQKYRWSEVQKIVKRQYLNKNWRPNEVIDIIKLEGERPYPIVNAFGTINVNEVIQEYSEFKFRINKYAGEYQIPLCFVDERVARSKATPQERRKAMREGVSADRI